MSGLASVSVDLDSLHHYCRIHGLSEGLLDAGGRELIYRRALPRFLELFEAAGIKATLFAIGEDALLSGGKRGLSAAVQAGHEVGNHSFSHDYALSRRPQPEIVEDLRRAQTAIAEATGSAPVGFRAPGYTLSTALYRASEEVGFAYGSSTFPAPPYYLAKASVMAALRLIGRPSRAVLDSPAVLAAPKRTYRPDPDHPYRRGKGRVVELPMAVSPRLGIPFIGTLALSFPWGVVKRTYRSLRRLPHLNFELHGIDLLEAADGVPLELSRAQSDLRIPLAQKRERLSEIFGWLRQDFAVVPLRQAAASAGAGL